MLSATYCTLYMINFCPFTQRASVTWCTFTYNIFWVTKVNLCMQPPTYIHIHHGNSIKYVHKSFKVDILMLLSLKPLGNCS